MKPSNPIIIDGKIYDIYSINLAVTSKYLGDGNEDASIAMRLIPTRIENGEVITADAEARCMALGSLDGADAPTLNAVATIKSALQTYIDAKGL